MAVNISISEVDTGLKDFFNYWLIFTRPMHGLAPKEMESLAVILHKRYELSRVITNEDRLNTFLFSSEIRAEMLKELKMKSTDFSCLLTKYRRKGVLSKSNVINPVFIPELAITNKDIVFKFGVIFNITNDLAMQEQEQVYSEDRDEQREEDEGDAGQTPDDIHKEEA